MKEIFRKVSAKISVMVGSAASFILALTVVIIWGLTGPMFGFSDTWQLVINTGTTIITFLMVFLIQNTQNRDSKALHLKLDELIHSSKAARDSFLRLDDLSDEALGDLDSQFKAIHDKLPNSKQVHILHSKIAAEKERRGALHIAGQAITNILNTPINPSKDSNKKDK